ncbi:MAG: ROK family protein [Deltaproteobacteria bacterium]|nr:ROK family protein [Deltaproteobacteria bacterium]
MLLQPTNFPRWGDIRIGAPLCARLGIPVHMQNDAAAAAAAEGWLGGARGLRNWMVLTFGTGLGTGVVIDGELFMGGSGLGPEAGHFIITDRPYRCGCGNSGCAEAVLSGTALRRRIVENRAEWKRRGRAVPADPEQLVLRARAGDVVAKRIFAEFSEMLARAIHNYAVVFSPQKIFFSGGLKGESDLFLPRTTALVANLLKGRPEIEPKLEVSSLGREASVLSGAWVACSGTLKKSE